MPHTAQEKVQRPRMGSSSTTGDKNLTSESEDVPSPTADVYCKTAEANRKTLLKKRNWMEEEKNMPVTYELEEMSVRDIKIMRGR